MLTDLKKEAKYRTSLTETDQTFDRKSSTAFQVALFLVGVYRIQPLTGGNTVSSDIVFLGDFEVTVTDALRHAMITSYLFFIQD